MNVSYCKLINFYLKILIIVIINSKNVFAFDFIDKNSKKIPAAWVWEVSKGDRVIYLVGEMHAFIDVKESDVDFSFGEYIYNASSKVYIEPIADMPNLNRIQGKLSEKLNLDAWDKIDELIKLNIAFLRKQDKDKEEMHKKWLAEIDNQSPILADFNIRLMTYSKYLHASKKKSSIEYGMSYKLEKIDALKPNEQKKNIALESSTILDDMWYQNCDDKITTQKYIDVALSLSNIDYYWNSDKRQKIQNAFSENEDIENNFMSVWMINTPGSELMLKCNIIPRNILISEKIEKILTASDSPVAFVMGIGHLLGKDGVLNLLKRNNFSNLRMVFFSNGSLRY